VTGPAAVPDLLWDDVADLLAPDGSLLDIYVVDAVVADWQSVLDLVRTRGWRHAYRVGGTPARLPAEVVDVFAEHPGASTTLGLWPAPGLGVTTHFFTVDEIEFDVDRRDVQGQPRLDALCDFLRAVGTAVGKPVDLTSEDGSQHPLRRYSPARDRFTDPGPAVRPGSGARRRCR
jgi:hypothetical protein